VSIIRAVAYVEKARWEAEVAKANASGVPMPSPAVFIPNEYIQVMRDDEPLRYRGKYFRR